TLITWKASIAQPIHAQASSTRSKTRPDFSANVIALRLLPTPRSAATVSVADDQRFDLAHLLCSDLGAERLEAGFVRHDVPLLGLVRRKVGEGHAGLFELAA